MSISYKNVAKALVLLILATSFIVARHVFWVITNPDFYKSIVGAIWIAGVVPYFLVVIGCLLFLLLERHGLPLILLGGVLSLFGTNWSYIPYLPAVSADPVIKLMLLVTGNLSVLALLIWSSRMRGHDKVSVE